MNSSARLCLAFAILCRAAIAAAASGPISGHVLDSAGKPVSGATVSLEVARSREQKLLDETQGRMPKPLSETKTGEGGAFTVKTDRDALELVLRVSAPGQPSLELEGFEEQDTAEGLELVLAAPARCGGVVRDSSGRPVAGARVRVESKAEAGEEGVSFAEAKSGADGRFSIANAPDGEIRISVRSPGFAPGSSYRGGTPRPDSVIVRRGGGVEGSVLDPEGKPVRGAIVVAGDAAAESDAAGRYRIEGLAAGPSSVSVVAKDGLAARRDGVPIRAGEVAKVDLRLQPSATIAGLVRDERTRKPIAGARIEIRRVGPSWAGEGSEAQGRTDARGRFRVAGLVPTMYTVSAQKAGYLARSADATASRGAAGSEVALALRRAGVITGRVVGEDGQPIAAARVQWTSSAAIQKQFDPSAAGARKARTRKDGTFRVRGIPSGQGLIEARKDGFVPARRDGISAAGGDAASKPLVLTLRRGLEARGRVLDREGQPVPAAEIRIHATSEADDEQGYWNDLSSGKPAAISDSDGRFVLHALAASEYIARVFAAGHGGRTFAGLAVTAPGPAAWKDFVLGQSAPVAGTVRNRAGEPVSDAAIHSYGGSDGVTIEALSDSEGRFILDGFPAGAVVHLDVRAEGYARHQQTASTPSENVVVVLAVTATLRGRVQDAETQKPIESFSIGWYAAGHSSWASTEQEVEAPDGAFELSGVVPGKIAVTAKAAGYVEGEMGGLEMKEGETREDVVVSLRKGLEIEGRIVDAEHRTGISGATVGWEPEGTGEIGTVYFSGSAGEYAVLPHSTRTDGEGRFHSDGIPPGRIRVTAQHADYRGASKVVDASGGKDVEIALGVGGSIAGVVVDSAGLPVGSARVALEEQGDARMEDSGDESKSSADGTFAFRHLAEGRFRLRASAAAGRSEPVDIVLSGDQKLDGVTLALKPGARIAGQVTGLRADRLGGLHTYGRGNGWEAEAITDDGGAFQLKNVPPGTYTIYASTSFYGKSVSSKVEVPPDTDEVPVEIVFEGDSHLTGRVLRSGRGLAGANLEIEPDPEGSGSINSHAISGPDGDYRFEELPDGAYLLSVRTTGPWVSRPVAVSGDTNYDFVLGTGSLTGLVKDDETGEPLPGAQVQAETGKEDFGYAIRHATSDSRGAYEIYDLDPGPFQVTARRDGYAANTVEATVAEEPIAVDIALHRSPGQRIRVSDALTGRPLRGVDALAFAATGATAFHGVIRLDEEGRGEVPSLSPGPYAIYLFAEGLSPRQVDVSVPSGEIVVALSPGGQVDVRASFPVTGRIVDGAGRLYINSPGRITGEIPIVAPVTTLRNVAPGAYRLVVGTEDGEKSWDFTVTEGATTALELR